MKQLWKIRLAAILLGGAGCIPTVAGGSGGSRFPEAEPVWPVDRPGADHCAGLHTAGNGI